MPLTITLMIDNIITFALTISIQITTKELLSFRVEKDKCSAATLHFRLTTTHTHTQCRLTFHMRSSAPVIFRVTSSVISPVTSPVTSSATSPATLPVTSPATSPATLPVTSPVTSSATSPVTLPVTSTVTSL
ncbi:hypothetical protein BgiBS90_003455 [Biomphalaria glabrata]|nr:hypothetical protein BgiBS90_003455 [Biomphalaria glabrata]